MSYEALDLPIVEITLEEKRAIPEFVTEEQRALLRLAHPEIKRPVRPTYAFIKNRTPDLEPREVSSGIKLWQELRYLATGEMNHALWAGSVVSDETEHQLVVHSVHSANNASSYSHRALRCNCCLPDWRDTSDIGDEYQPCAGKETVIDERTKIFRKILGLEAVSGRSLTEATSFLITIVMNNPEKWAPTDRSDRLLVGKLAEVFEVPTKNMMRAAQELEVNNVVQLRGEHHPSIMLAA